MDGDGVAVVARGDERPDDGVGGLLQLRRRHVAPGQAPAADELELVHRQAAMGARTNTGLVCSMGSCSGSVSQSSTCDTTRRGSAVLWAGDQATRALRAAANRGTAADLVHVIVGLYRRALVDTEFAAGCPIGMVAQESHQNEHLRAAAKQVFDAWRAILEQTLQREGRPSEHARALADAMVAGIEGGLLIARIDQSPDALDHVEQVLLTALGSRA